MVKEEVLVGGYSEELFLSKPHLKNKQAWLYYIDINNGEYFKIGITTVSIHNRFKGIKSKAKKYGYTIKKLTVISNEPMDLYTAFKKEQQLLTQHRNKRIYTEWSTELFIVDIQSRIN
jgi:hypothetical protein